MARSRSKPVRSLRPRPDAQHAAVSLSIYAYAFLYRRGSTIEGDARPQSGRVIAARAPPGALRSRLHPNSR
jgi:hypothetical protein